MKFSVGRGINWTLPNRRPEKLKESLQELEVVFLFFSLANCHGAKGESSAI